ncbi:MAG: elongation factor G [Candidatus Poribacteria bacterium]|nr:elongation factor G [Candidatus Poribacteria bacterium]
MKEYRTEQIRNIGVIAHSSAGKTSLIEAILYNGGAIERMGRVDNGNSVSDYAPDEIERKTTINCSVCVAEWKGYKLNLIDTPGAEDFYGDLESALRAVDAVIVVIDATTGVEGGTEKVWEVADKYELPRLIFINKMDKENASFENALASLGEILEARTAVIQQPIGKESDFKGVVDLVQMGAFMEAGGNQSEIPSELQDQAEEMREQLIEIAAESDDELIEKFFEGELTDEEISAGLRTGFCANQFVPVLCGTALQNIGVQPLMDAIVNCFPSPLDAKPVKAADGETTYEASPDSSMSALVFKTMADPFTGRLTFFRVYSGILEGDSQVYNATKAQNERIGKLLFMSGKNSVNTPQIAAGDLGVVSKLTQAQTGDTFCKVGQSFQLPGIEFPKPVISYAIRPAREGDDEKLSTTLARMTEEDPAFTIERNDVTQQLLVSGLGEVHLSVIRSRMKDKFGLETEIEEPKVPYQETIRGRANGIQGRYKRQSGGRGQFGEVWINLSPLERGSGFEFLNSIKGGSIPRNYIPAVEKGIRETMAQGVIVGYPFVDAQVELYDGKHHAVDSSDMAFQIAGSFAFRESASQSNPVLLEPIMNVTISVPGQFMGDVIGDLNSKRGRIMDVEQAGKRQVIQATVPLAEMFRYSIDLKSITSARGSFTMEFASYEVVPDEIAQKVIAETKAEAEA